MLTIGSFVGNAYEVDRDETTGRFIRGLLDWSGVSRPVEVNDPDIEVRMLQSGEERLVFVFNHAGQAKTAAVKLPGVIRDLETGKRVEKIERELPANGVAVYVVR